MTSVFCGLNSRIPGAMRMALPFRVASAVLLTVSSPRSAASGKLRTDPMPEGTWAVAGVLASTRAVPSAAARARQKLWGDVVAENGVARQRVMVCIQRLG